MVSADQSRAVSSRAAHNLITALEDWKHYEPLLRAVETLQHGEPKTPFLRFGDRVEIDALDESGRSIFGRIDHHMLQSPGDGTGAIHA
jgi:hypothetical protein